MGTKDNQDVIDRLAKRYSSEQLAKEIDIKKFAAKYDAIVAETKALSKASAALADAYKHAFSKPFADLSALRSLKQATDIYFDRIQKLHNDTRNMPTDASHLKNAAEVEYHREIQRLNDARRAA
ncbi:MAG: hypothetical protein KJ574_04585, partial [Nanoarchaeota archaeon]|nr:hypothetical protein [Nanoarchaeota archaeon]